MIPTVIEYLLIVLVILFTLPYGFYWFAKIPFLHMEVLSYSSALYYMFLTVVLGLAFACLLYLLTKLKLPRLFLFLMGFVFAFLTNHIADLVVDSVTLPLWFKIVVALFSNTYSNVAPTAPKKAVVKEKEEKKNDDDQE